MIFFDSKSISQNYYKIIATVNNKSITYLDIINEIEILKIINPNKNSNDKDLKNVALNNLINEKIKQNEINENKITTSEKLINNYYLNFIKNLNLDLKKNKIFLENKIKEKIEIETNWNKVIQKNYTWKININTLEIDKKIEQLKNKNSSESELLKIKEKLIESEKEKKLKVFSNFHLNKIRKNNLVKYYK